MGQSKAKVKAYQAIPESKAKVKANKLKRKFGITIEDYNQMFDDQEGCCAICGKHQSEFKTVFAVDHDHETCEVRGLLCSKCNIGIGNLQDNIIILEKAIKYLKKMTKLELKQIRDFYEQVILQGIILPLEINKIYKYIHPNELTPERWAYKIKQRAISVFVQNKQWETLKILEDLFDEKPLPEDELNESIGTIKNKDKWSHQEESDLNSQPKNKSKGRPKKDLAQD